MRRPLVWVAVCLVILAAVRLKMGSRGGPEEGRGGTDCLTAREELVLTGQVYRKDDNSFFLTSVSLIVSDFSEFNAAAHSAAGSQRQIPVRENIKCEYGGAEEIPLGCVVTLSGTFMPFSRATNPGEFDAAEYYGALGTGGRLTEVSILTAGQSFWRLREGLYRLKLYFRRRLYQVYPEREAAVMCALLLGDQSELDAELKDLYRRNGILHILSISSLHITIIGMSLYRLLRRGGVPIGVSACAGSVLLILYGGMTGFPVSACRAIGMYLLRMTAELLGRTYDMTIALGILAAAMVTVNPGYLQNSGFLLSFTSVLGIAVVYQGFAPGRGEPGEGRSRWRRVRDGAEQSFLAGACVTLTTLPVQLWFYYEAPVWSVLINLLVMPFMKPLLIMGLAVMLMPFAGFLEPPVCLILKGYEFLCRFFAGLPFPVWNPGRPGIWQIAAYYGILFFAAALCGRKRTTEKGTRRSFLRRRGIILLFPLGIFLLGIRPAAEDRVTFLDVGQGDCILVQTAAGGNYLFDCGSSSRSGVGRYVLLPFLKYNGIHRLDAVILSHPDGDHINGAGELLGLAADNGIDIVQLVLPAASESAGTDGQFREILRAAEGSGKEGVPARRLAAGEGFESGGAEFLCLHPAGGWTAAGDNAGSLCVCVRFPGGATLLLTGDVDGAGEIALKQELLSREIGDITILKVAHHGSRYATSESFLQQVRPAVSVISCGRKNRYGHPHGETLERLEKTGTRIYRTDESGAVTLTIRKGQVEVRTYGLSR